MTTATIQPPIFHFYLNNIFEWRTGNDLHTLMKAMDKQKQTYWVWYVPGDSKSTYDINWYAPQVEGAFVLTRVEYSKGKRVVNKSAQRIFGAAEKILKAGR